MLIDRGVPLRSLFQPLHFTCSSFEDVWIWHTYIFPFNRNLASLWTLWDHSCSFIYLQGSVAPLTEEISWYGSGRSNVGKSRPRGEACGGQDGPTDDEPTWRRLGLAGRRCLFHCNHLHPCCNQVILRVCVCVHLTMLNWINFPWACAHFCSCWGFYVSSFTMTAWTADIRYTGSITVTVI